MPVLGRTLSQTALIIFAKEPVLGKVKTRLQRALPAVIVLNLYKAFIEDVVAIVREVPCDKRFIYYSSSNGQADHFKVFKRNFILRKQVGSSLGDRMQHAFVQCRKEGFARMVIIGSDCLTIKKEDIVKAFQKLNGVDVVIGPSEDGGYFLIGVREPDAAIFKKVTWSTSTVLKQTVKNIQVVGKRYQLLRKRYDIDTAASLSRFAGYAKTRRLKTFTARYLGEIGKDRNIRI